MGQVVVTVSDRLRVRSLPEVSDASIRYEPLLPLGTELLVLEGPVSGSGYTWYRVRPIAFEVLEPPGEGWVAMAGKDGEPWIALQEPELAGIEVVQASVARTRVDPAAAGEVADAINEFGFDLLRALVETDTIAADENAVVSPTSIAFALAMARAGAEGDTAREMDEVLHVSGWGDLGPGLNALESVLSGHDAAWRDEEDEVHELKLRISNAAFGQSGWSIEPAYLERIAETFGAGLRLVDYLSATEATRRLINAWVAGRTAQRIRELIPEGAITEVTRLVLVNAIYLKANWALEFRSEDTARAAFRRPDGSSVQVPMMRLDGGQEVPYARGNGWRATELRYLGGTWQTGRPEPLAMMLIVPEDLAAFERQLSAAQLGRIADALDEQRAVLQRVTHDPALQEADCGTYAYSLGLAMPRFSIDMHALLKPSLMALGMSTAFDQARADFTGIHKPEVPEETLAIGAVIHQANIDVDEKGTEAAAATAVTFDTGGCTGPAPAKQISLQLDRPFLFVLRDVETGAVLFLGRVTDPSR